MKNIGMGCGSRAGKMQQHASGKPAINAEACRGCKRCSKECGSDAITYVNKKAVIDYDKLEPAAMMQYTIRIAVQMNFWIVKWQSMHRLSVMDVLVFTFRWYRISVQTVIAMGRMTLQSFQM